MSKWYEINNGNWGNPHNSLQELLLSITEKYENGFFTMHSLRWIGHGKLELNFEFTPKTSNVNSNIYIRVIELIS